LPAEGLAVPAVFPDFVEAVELLVTVPETAFEVSVPLATWPEVLTYNFFSVSGFCQYSGATSITTAYWFIAL
jgi:hypothetical protein